MRLRDAVRIEKRAAAIAAQMLHELLHDMTVEELVGWMRCGDNRERGSYPKSHAWQAGWLAAHIFNDNRYGRSVVEHAPPVFQRRNDRRWVR
jgi:hypothetical protein